MRSKHGSACVFLLALFPLVSGAAGEGLAAPILEKVKAGTVFLLVGSGMSQGQGSGFLVGPRLLATNAHVLGIGPERAEPAGDIRIVFHSGVTGKEFVLPGAFVSADVDADLAFVEFPEPEGSRPPLASLDLCAGKELRETMPVFIVGFPFGHALAGRREHPAVTVGSGTVSSLRMDEHGFLDAIQINGDLNPGNSGGPVVNQQGQVVAVSVSTIRGTGIGFAIPCDTLRREIEGRVIEVAYSNCRVHAGRCSFDVSARVIDPMKRIRQVAFYYWTGFPDSPRPVNARTKLQIHGAQGDGPRIRINLAQDAQTGEWRGSARNLTVPPEQQVFTQTGCLRSGLGEKLTQVCLSVEILQLAEAGPPVARPATAKLIIGPQQPGQVVDPIRPNAHEALEGTEERDESGQRYTAVTSSAKNIPLSGELKQIVCPPSGREVYAIFEGQSGIKVLDPTTLKELAEIGTPRSPVSLWCDESRIAAACAESKVLVIIDSVRRVPTKSVVLRDDTTLQPLRVLGLAPDGSFMTVWKAPGTVRWDMFLYHVSPLRSTRRILKGEVEWGVYTHGGKYLFAQHNFKGSPSGVPELLNPVDGERIDLSDNGLFGKNAGFHRSFAHCFYTTDGKHLVMPTGSLGSSTVYGVTTYLADPNLSRREIELPGVAVAEVAKDNLLVSWGPSPNHSDSPMIYYASRSTGRVVRRISVKGISLHPAHYLSVKADKDTVYVPGHELFLWVYSVAREKSVVAMVRCGPVAGGQTAASDPKTPTAEARIGKPFTFTPQFKRPEGARKVTFRLKSGPPDIQVDAETGKVNWTPTDAYLGKYDVVLVADVDGTEVPVATWAIEVRF